MDYVALGDWHGYSDHSQGNVRAVYSGSPEPMTFDQSGAGFVASVTLEDDAIQVDRVRVGKIEVKQLELDVSGRTEADIQAIILDRTSPETMLEVTLIGLNPLGSVIDPVRMEETTAPKVYAIRIRDQSHPQLDEVSPADFPKEHAIGKFIDIMMERIVEAQDDEERTKTEQALQLGIALLQGKEVI
jgi:DNA repair exonuclease SbcCD nuclease subunit